MLTGSIPLFYTQQMPLAWIEHLLYVNTY